MYSIKDPTLKRGICTNKSTLLIPLFLTVKTQCIYYVTITGLLPDLRAAETQRYDGAPDRGQRAARSQTAPSTAAGTRSPPGGERRPRAAQAIRPPAARPSTCSLDGGLPANQITLRFVYLVWCTLFAVRRLIVCACIFGKIYYF